MATNNKMIKCPSCKSIYISITVDTTAYLCYLQDANGLHPNGGEQDDIYKRLASCTCQDCGREFKVRVSTLDKMELNDNMESDETA